MLTLSLTSGAQAHSAVSGEKSDCLFVKLHSTRAVICLLLTSTVWLLYCIIYCEANTVTICGNCCCSTFCDKEILIQRPGHEDK